MWKFPFKVRNRSLLCLAFVWRVKTYNSSKCIILAWKLYFFTWFSKAKKLHPTLYTQMMQGLRQKKFKTSYIRFPTCVFEGRRSTWGSEESLNNSSSKSSSTLSSTCTSRFWMAGSSIKLPDGGECGVDASQPESEGSSLQTEDIFTIKLGFFFKNDRINVLSLEQIVWVDRTSFVMMMWRFHNFITYEMLYTYTPRSSLVICDRY